MQILTFWNSLGLTEPFGTTTTKNECALLKGGLGERWFLANCFPERNEKKWVRPSDSVISSHCPLLNVLVYVNVETAVIHMLLTASIHTEQVDCPLLQFKLQHLPVELSNMLTPIGTRNRRWNYEDSVIHLIIVWYKRSLLLLSLAPN